MNVFLLMSILHAAITTFPSKKEKRRWLCKIVKLFWSNGTGYLIERHYRLINEGVQYESEARL